MTSEVRQVQLRLDPKLLAAIDERAKRYKISRHRWITLMLERGVAMPSQTSNEQVRF